VTAVPDTANRRDEMSDASKIETTEVVVWVLVDEGGDYVACEDGDSIHERYDEVIGGDRDTQSMRRVKVTLTVPLPKPVELVGTVPAEPAGGELAVA
jgi:hypothetical protein